MNNGNNGKKTVNESMSTFNFTQGNRQETPAGNDYGWFLMAIVVIMLLGGLYQGSQQQSGGERPAINRQQ